MAESNFEEREEQTIGAAVPGPQWRTTSEAYIPLRLSSAGGSERREYNVSFIQAGRVSRRDGELSNWLIPAETIQNALDKFAGLAVFVDHTVSGFFVSGHPSMRDLAAVTFGAVWNAERSSVDGGIRLYGRSDLEWLRTLLDEIVQDQIRGIETPNVGLSLVFFGETEWEGPEDAPIRITKAISHIESCDIVFGPGAAGRIREVLVSSSRVSAPALDAFAFNNLLEGTMPEENEVEVEGSGSAEVAVQAEDGGRELVRTPDDVLVPDGGSEGLDRIGRLEAVMLRMAESVAQMQGQVSREADRRVISDMGVGVAPRGQQSAQVRGSWLNSYDQIERAYEDLMGLPVSGPPIHHLSGIRELYLLLTGDRNFRGEYNRDLVPSYLAYSSSGNNADTSTMAELTRNVMNKRLIQQVDLMDEYSWWKEIAVTENFNSLQQVSWIIHGGIGYDSGTGLPTVAEKGEYQQLLWEDARTTASWVKKGGYLPLSLEMIDRDDVAGWRAVPRQLAVAEVVTISSVISNLFTDNSGAGASLGDGVGDGFAFNTTRGNLITQALDQATWGLAVETMYKLAELKNSTQTEDRRMATRPRKVLVPIELEQDGITAVTSPVKTGTLADRYPGKRLLREEDVVTVPHWTNSGNWAAVADKNSCPFAGVAFRFGETPEIFAPSENNHILWLHDVLPIKARWFFAISVINWRGAVKSNQ